MAEEAQLVSYLKRMTVDLHDARQKLREADDAAHEPIAIVGVSAIFPPGTNIPEAAERLIGDLSRRLGYEPQLRRNAPADAL